MSRAFRQFDKNNENMYSFWERYILTQILKDTSWSHLLGNNSFLLSLISCNFESKFSQICYLMHTRMLIIMNHFNRAHITITEKSLCTLRWKQKKEGIHRVRRLVFNNYQRCPVPLKPLDPFCSEKKNKSSQIYK